MTLINRYETLESASHAGGDAPLVTPSSPHEDFLSMRFRGELDSESFKGVNSHFRSLASVCVYFYPKLIESPAEARVTLRKVVSELSLKG